jgi:HrpA-like RNA helicase
VAIKRAVRELVELDALDVGDGGEQLTALGVHLSTLPVDVRIGKLILLGTIFGVVDETLTMPPRSRTGRPSSHLSTSGTPQTPRSAPSPLGNPTTWQC